MWSDPKTRSVCCLWFSTCEFFCNITVWKHQLKDTADSIAALEWVVFSYQLQDPVNLSSKNFSALHKTCYWGGCCSYRWYSHTWSRGRSVGWSAETNKYLFNILHYYVYKILQISYVLKDLIKKKAFWVILKLVRYSWYQCLPSQVSFLKTRYLK